MTWTPTVQSCDSYLDERSGKYEFRAVRYRRAADWIFERGLDHGMTVVDIGAGMTEFDYTLRAEYGWRGRYIPVDGGIDGTDLNEWTPPRDAHFFVGLEIVEHLNDWRSLVVKLKRAAHTGIVLSTPNPRTTDVIGMDPTHVCEVSYSDLANVGFDVVETMFYGGVFSHGEPDSLFATWSK